uniref:PPP4R1 n=1 Tax=Heterorhabditis bacteriophora TaxID=37862 RepID=A0A1I7WHI9_HETBA
MSTDVSFLYEVCQKIEESDEKIRMTVIKNLPSTCKHNVEYVNQNIEVGDVLAQLLNVHDSHELTLVNNSLCALLRKHPKVLHQFKELFNFLI